MALTAGVPIVPVAVHGTEKLMPVGTNRPRLVKVSVTFGEPLDFTGRFDGVPLGKARRVVTDEVMAAIAALSARRSRGSTTSGLPTPDRRLVRTAVVLGQQKRSWQNRPPGRLITRCSRRREAWNAGPMTIDEVTEYVEALDGVLTLRPQEGDGSPEIAWGDLFFYYAPDGVVPQVQPFATIVTKDYPDDTTSRLDRPDAFRVNVAAGSEAFRRWTEGEQPDPSTSDVVMAHPVYGSLSWLCVVNPGPETEETLRDLLRTAYDKARARRERRSAPSDR